MHDLIPPSNKRQTYACDFGRGLRAAIVLDLGSLRPGVPINSVLEIHWSGPPPTTTRARQKVLCDYCTWKAGILQSVADQTGLRILDATQVGKNKVSIINYVPRTG